MAALNLVELAFGANPAPTPSTLLAVDLFSQTAAFMVGGYLAARAVALDGFSEGFMVAAFAVVLGDVFIASLDVGLLLFLAGKIEHSAGYYLTTFALRILGGAIGCLLYLRLHPWLAERAFVEGEE